jgi:hypothetical protein
MSVIYDDVAKVGFFVVQLLKRAGQKEKNQEWLHACCGPTRAESGSTRGMLTWGCTFISNYQV